MHGAQENHIPAARLFGEPKQRRNRVLGVWTQPHKVTKFLQKNPLIFKKIYVFFVTFRLKKI